MKKLSEIKTGEKFEYLGRYYMGMEAAEDDGTEAVLAIDLETGKTSDVTLHPDTLVQPVELDMMVEAIKVLKYKEGDALVFEHPGYTSIDAQDRFRNQMHKFFKVKVMVIEEGMKLAAVLRKASDGGDICK